MKTDTVDRTREFSKLDNEIVVTLKCGHTERFWVTGLSDDEYIKRARCLIKRSNEEIIKTEVKLTIHKCSRVLEKHVPELSAGTHNDILLGLGFDLLGVPEK